MCKVPGGCAAGLLTGAVLAGLCPRIPRPGWVPGYPSKLFLLARSESADLCLVLLVRAGILAKGLEESLCPVLLGESPLKGCHYAVFPILSNHLPTLVHKPTGPLGTTHKNPRLIRGSEPGPRQLVDPIDGLDAVLA